MFLCFFVLCLYVCVMFVVIVVLCVMLFGMNVWSWFKILNVWKFLLCVVECVMKGVVMMRRVWRSVFMCVVSGVEMVMMKSGCVVDKEDVGDGAVKFTVRVSEALL